MSTRSKHICRRLEKSSQDTQTFFSQIPSDQHEIEIYTEGAAWSLRQILAHLVMAEDGMARLVKGIVEGDEGVPDDFDLDSYNEYKVGKIENELFDELLIKFAAARAATIALVAQFDEDDFDKMGRHPWLGMARIEDILKLMYRHTQIHQREIRSALGEKNNLSLTE